MMITELRQAYEAVYGEQGVYALVGALSANVPDEVLERLLREVSEKAGN